MSAPGLMAEVQTRRAGDVRVPRILLHAPKDIDTRLLRAHSLRLQADIEERGAKDAPWTTQLDFGGSAKSIFGVVELHTFGGSDAECDKGLELLRGVAERVNRARCA